MHPCSLAPRNAQGDVHLASARKVESVQGHLRGGLPNALGGQQAHGLTRVTQRALPLQLQQGPQPEMGQGRGVAWVRSADTTCLSGAVNATQDQGARRYELSSFLGLFFLSKSC